MENIHSKKRQRRTPAIIWFDVPYCRLKILIGLESRSHGFVKFLLLLVPTF